MKSSLVLNLEHLAPPGYSRLEPSRPVRYSDWMNNVQQSLRITAVTLILFVGLPTTPVRAEEPLTHETIPTLTDIELGQMDRADAVIVSDNPNRDEAARLFFDIATQQKNTLPAYRERYQKAMNALLEIAVPEDPATFWKEFTSATTLDDVQRTRAYMIAAYELLSRDERRTPDGLLDVADETDEPHLRYRGDDESAASDVTLPESLLPIVSLFQRQWTRRDFGYPLLAGIDPEKVIVRQATWDDEYETLLFTLEPKGDEPVLTTIIIEYLYTNLMSILLQDGEFRAAIDEHAQIAGKDTRNLDPGQVEVQVRLEGRTRFTLKPME